MLTLHMETALSDEAIALLSEAIAEIKRRYPEEDICGAFDLADASGEGRTLIIARWNGEGVGCGVIRPFAEGKAELKRMFVREPARGKGIGKAILSRLEQEAKHLGYTAIVLETGLRQPEAIRLYESAGYHSIPCWGEYHNNSLSRCFEKSIL